MKVAPASVPRALLFVDTFVKTAEERGFAFALPESEYEPGLSIVIKRQKVKFSVFEESNRAMSTRSKGSLRSPSAQADIEFRPSGRFAFKFGNTYPQDKRRHSSVGQNDRSKVS